MQAIPKYRRPLNPVQQQILVMLYKFRFTTIDLIKQAHPNQTTQNIHSRLEILRDQGYIDRYYNSSYRLNGQPAVYYLASKGITQLSQQLFTSAKAINLLYHDKHRSTQYLDNRLQLFKIYLSLKEKYADQLKYYANTELYNQSDLPKPLPDALIKLDNHNYFLNYYDSSQSYTQQLMKLKRYIDWFESQDEQLPRMLMVCQTAALAKRMTRLVNKLLETTYIVFDYVSTTPDGLSQLEL
jgi:hypothetical protein